VAMYRALESERSDAVFRDPFARRLAGERGEQILSQMSFARKHSWSYVARTWLFDSFIAQEIKSGADMVINLAAGLDTRPYRMTLPGSLQWIEIDLPELIAYKEEVLRGEKPVCRLERVPLDLASVSARRSLFDTLSRRAKRAVIASEGLIIYLTAEEVCALGRDLAAPWPFQRWVTDLVSPGLLKMLQKQIGSSLSEAGAPLKFGPAEGPDFFTKCGWRPVDAQSMLKTGAKLKRLPFGMRLLALLPNTKPGSSRPWGGVCLLAKQ
jgi:methyltransferase (TIGR00027 family)